MNNDIVSRLAHLVTSCSNLAMKSCGSDIVSSFHIVLFYSTILILMDANHHESSRSIVLLTVRLIVPEMIANSLNSLS